MPEFWKEYLMVFFASMLKFLFGPILGATFKLGWLGIFIPTSCGMITTAVLLSWLGVPLRTWLLGFRKKKPKLFTKRNRQIVKIWRGYGIKGVAFLSPLLFSPPGGTLIAVSFGERKENIILWMSISAIFWGVVFSSIAVFLREWFLRVLG
ncbi:MAG: hypothetical protein EAZ57_06945 [Cytophagales bacterium]|nr:MAG: hypothetical protein EAZ67_07590 [Cytophagales bacterium]TAF60614.1 MAG: hypothetical protein EAZ57_06945 [Cytophagales bacterium]